MATAQSGYGVYADYQSDHEDILTEQEFARFNRVASCMVDYLAGRGVDGENPYVREAVHWQIWFMRQKGSLAACFQRKPHKERFAEYTVELDRDSGNRIVCGIELCPMTLSMLRGGGIVSDWL